MTTRSSLRIGLLIASAFLLTTAFAASKAERDEIMSHDGLQKISVKGIDVAYARPGASLAGYNKVQIDPIEVSFSKSWDPDRPGSRQKLTTEERENIRKGVAKIVLEEFVKELQQKGSYQVVTAAGPDVLRIKASIIEVYVNAPDVMTAGPTRVYTLSAGEGTIVAELFDSETSQVIARVLDRREARDTGIMTLTNSVVNVAEARDIASRWARILRTRLDAAHGIGKK